MSASAKTPRLACALLAIISLCACSSDRPPSSGRGGVGSSGAGAADNPDQLADNPNLLTVKRAACTPHCMDFPAQPIFDHEAGATTPMDAARYFGAPDDFKAPGACVIEPQLSSGMQPGTLFPFNWLRPRFRWTPLPGENLWEIRLRVQNQDNPLVAYTTRTTWKLPREMWKALAQNSTDMPITVTIRGVNTGAGGKPSGTRGDFNIAPADAGGKLVYWAATSSEVKPDTSKLVGFDVGDEAVIDALTIPGVSSRGILAAGGRELRGKYDDPRGVPPGNVQCIGCHVSTPDGAAVAFTDHWPWNSVLASVEEATVGQQPTYLTPGAALLLNQPWLGMQTFSQAHFRQGDRVLVSVYSPRNMGQGAAAVGFTDSAPYPSKHDGLAWFDLETTATFTMPDPSKGDVQRALNDQVQAQFGQAFGLLNLEGETRSVAAPSFSHDGLKIAYTSADNTQDGRLSYNNQEVDIHIVPYGSRQGGTVMPLKGASDPGVAEYYPSWSADDGLIAFNRVAKIDGGQMYYRPDGEIYVVPAKGGTATRLMANDPPACTNQKSPGVINSWPKWSPRVVSVKSLDPEFGAPPRSFFWVVFSSARMYDGQFQLPKGQNSAGDARSSQLYMTAIVRDNTNGALTTYPATYIWNQDPKTSNLTPAWDDFRIPQVPGPD